MRKIAFAIPILLLALAACGQAAPSTAQPTSSGATAAPPTATSALPTEAPAATSVPPPTEAPTAAAPPTEAPAASPGQPTPASPGTSVRPPDALVAAAQQRLARHLGVPADSLMLQSANQKEWPDGALGCPQPGQVYPQIVTPGFVLVFSNSAQTQTYEVHTGRSEQQMILCENDQPIDLVNQASAPPTSAGDTAQTNPASLPQVELARQALAKEIGIDTAAIRLTQLEEVEWRDSSLGCPKPGLNYLQVITPGYRIVLEAQNRSYEYHSDTGKRVVRCDKLATPRPLP
jgi:hypothetical protein